MEALENPNMNFKQIHKDGIKLLFLLFFLSISGYAHTKNCINYKNSESNPISGELKVVPTNMFLDHGDIINHYFFLLDKNTCFSTEYGDWDIKQVQVILSKEQLKKIDQITYKKITMEIEDWMVGETQSWKTRIGILKAKFRLE